jgi:hypothetical protein
MRSWMMGLCLALSACAVPTTGSGVLTTSPAPLASNVAVRQGLVTTWQAYQVAIQATQLLIKVGVIKPGSADALYIAGLNDRIHLGLNAANAAVDAGSEKDYSAALSDAQQALTQLQAALGSK